MTNDEGAKPGSDWLSAPVGTTSTASSSSNPGFESSTAPAKASGSAVGTVGFGGTADDDTQLTARAVEEPADGPGSKYKSSFTNSLATTGGLYPGGESQSPAYGVDPTPGPATSIGLGSSATATGTATAARPAKAKQRGGGPRRAKLQIRHIDPWSTLKLSLVLAVAFFFVWMIAVAVLYGVLSAMGVFESIDGLFAEFGTDAGRIVTPKLVFGGAALIGAINIVLFTALATIGAYIYNLCADLAGGLEITLAERR